MKRKPFLRHLTDLAMTVLLIMQMAYSTIGQEIHEWTGIFLGALFVVHHLLNRKWIQAVRKGRYSAVRILQSVLVLLLLLSMTAQIISGIAMSQYVLSFLNVPLTTSTARLIHLSCGYWSFLLAAVHLGIHWGTFLGVGRKIRGGKPLSPTGRTVLRLLAACAAVYGLVCFIQQDILSYLFLRIEFVFFDYEKPAFLAMLELAAVFEFWVMTGHYIFRIATGKKKKFQDN